MHCISRTFLDYWFSLEKHDGIPFHHAISPFDLRAILPHLFKVDYVAEADDFFFRLFGSHIADTVGQDNSNKYLSDFLPQRYAGEIHAVFKEVMDHQIAIVTTERIIKRPHDYKLVEVLRMPFRAKDGTPTSICGTFSWIDDTTTSISKPGKVQHLERIELTRRHLVLASSSQDWPATPAGADNPPPRD